MANDKQKILSRVGIQLCIHTPHILQAAAMQLRSRQRDNKFKKHFVFVFMFYFTTMSLCFA